MNKVAAFALRRKNSILSMSEKMFCPPQPLRFWITPACAGKRCRSPAFRSMPWDHPRVCGEKKSAVEAWTVIWGSPPRVRGKDKPDEKKFTFGRITPACAGKRARPSPCRSQSRDHPRACGEKSIASQGPDLVTGSPPRVRGKGHPHHPDDLGIGITPAYAGKSRLYSS